MATTVSTDELESSFDEKFERVFGGERIVVTLDGEPAALILHPQDPLVDRLYPDGHPDL